MAADIMEIAKIAVPSLGAGIAGMWAAVEKISTRHDKAIAELLASALAEREAAAKHVQEMLQEARDERESLMQRYEAAVKAGNDARDEHAKHLSAVSGMVNATMVAVQIAIEGMREKLNRGLQ